MKPRYLLGLVIAFGIGYASHYGVERADFITKSFIPTKSVTSDQVAGQSSDQFISYVNWDGQKFTPSEVTMKKSYYIAITNTDPKSRMWLDSDNPLLKTSREYGETERLQVSLYEAGIYKVINKLKPNYSLIVKVE